MIRLAVVGSKEDDVVLVVRRDADEAIGSDILYGGQEDENGDVSGWIPGELS